MRKMVVSNKVNGGLLLVEKNVYFMRASESFDGVQKQYVDISMLPRVVQKLNEQNVVPDVLCSVDGVISLIRRPLLVNIVTTKDIDKKVAVFDSLDELHNFVPNMPVYAFADSVVAYQKLKDRSDVKFVSFIPKTFDHALYLTLDSKLTRSTVLNYVLSPSNVVIVYERLSGSNSLSDNGSSESVDIALKELFE